MGILRCCMIREENIMTKRNVWYAMAGILIFLGLGVPVRATEVTMTLQQTTRDVEIKEKPDQNANTVSELPAGTGVVVYGEPQNSWSQIEYAGVSGYVESNTLRAYPVDGIAEELEQEVKEMPGAEEMQEDSRQVTDEDEMEQQSEQAPTIDAGSDIESSASETYAVDGGTEELDQEFEEVEEEMLRVIDEHELVQKSKQTSRIWGVVIGALVIAIFAVGVVSALKKDKGGETEKVEEKKEEET